ncbi:MAG: selenocysteine-specific translation elongation factor [Burkholderiales bacterium]|nr:selenocysteine-specific translation elongation factor [Burkholderiales bacterium]
MIIGTAGHIDHGKTTLVRALTGVDTDRLPEERARGISIELGYAYTPLANGDVLGFVDVPGHEKFVHTMLAGASGIDFALLAVAADDGVMPQTREHLDILRLLGVPAGAIAITKIDVVETGRIAEVERELRALVARTVLAGAPIFAVSARTGAGLDALRRLLEARAQAHRRRADDGHFRLAVDRSFALTGIGTVVTGTVHSGEIAVGAHLVIAPGGTQVRVRSIHAQNRASERARAGERCALNLVGIGHQDVGRGDWVVAPPIGLATGRFDARLDLLDGETKAFGSAAALHVHVGTARVPGRLVTLEAQVDDAGSGSRPLAQLVLQAPIAAWRGDRFILRDASAMRTIGGGRVLDPFAPARYRRSPQRLTVLRALEADTPASQLTALIGCEPLGVDLRRFASAGNVRDVSAVVPEAGVRRVTGEGVDFAIAEGHWQTLQVRAEEHLATFHQAHPDELGPDSARLKRMAFPRLDNALYRALIADLLAQGRILRGGPWLHLPGHDDAPSAADAALLEKLLPHLLDTPFDPPWVRDLARACAQPETVVRNALMRASKRGQTFQVVRDLFYHPRAIRELAALANCLQATEGEVRAAAFRDRTALGRKRAIQILEFFDRVGFTRRVREKHLVRADSLAMIDIAPAVRPECGR